MKKRLILVLAILTLVMAFTVVIGCSSSTPSSSSNVATAEDTLPPLEPADHAGRWESGGGKYCVSCHGTAASTGDNASGAPSIPADHYVNNDTSKDVDPVRMQCITCHPLSEVQ